MLRVKIPNDAMPQHRKYSLNYATGLKHCDNDEYIYLTIETSIFEYKQYNNDKSM